MATFDYQAAISAGYKPEDVNKFLDSRPDLQAPDRPDQNPIARAVKSIPVLGGLLTPAINTAEDLATGAAYKMNPQLQTPEMAKYFAGPAWSSDINQNYAQRGLETGASVAAVADLPFAAKNLATSGPVKNVTQTIKNIPQYLNPKYITKGSTYQQIAKAAQGAAPDWAKVMETARADAQDETASVKKALEGLLKEENPLQPITGRAGTQAGISTGTAAPATQAWTGQQALNLRSGLGKRIPSNLLQALSGGSVPSEKKAAIDILRRAVSGELKRVAPDITTPDKVYSFYSKIHGDAPTWAKRLVGGFVADKVIGNKLGGVPRDLVDVLGGVMLGGL